MKVFRKEKEITLGPKEYKLLDFLIKQPKSLFKRAVVRTCLGR